MTYRVFVSFSASDWPLVHEIRSAVRPLGIAVYSYDQDPRPGVSISQKLIGAIRSSNAVVALLTREGAASPAVNQEIGVARQAGKVIIPILEKGVDPARITLLQGIECGWLDRADVSGAIARLARRLAALKAAASGRARWTLAALIGGALLWSRAAGGDEEG